MEDGPDREELGVLARRLDFVDALTEGPLHKRDLVEQLDHSRSTVDRAIEELETAGFVERVSRGYVTTQTGALAAERYQRFLTEFDDQLAASPVVDAVSHDHDLPLSLFEASDVDEIDGPYELFARVSDIVGSGAACRIVLPTVFDSRHVRVWHSQVVRGDRTIELFADEALLEQLAAEFPRLTNELADTEGFSAHEIPTPPFGLVVPASEPTDQETPPVLLVTYEDDEIAGVVEMTGAKARAWAHEQCEQHREQGERATERLWSEEVTSALSLVSGTRLSPGLQSEGFALLDEQFFEDREPIPPETGWRAGIGLPEVADGQSVDRTAEGESLTQTVSEKLDDGVDVTVLGPPGTGKSTLCKQVAYEWAQDRDRHVIYRESGQGQQFTSGRLLEDHLREATDTVLVVVEDAIRAEANEIFGVMHRLAGRDDVVFLLDAREDEWHDDTQLDARLDAFRHSTPDVVSMPPVDSDDCRELIGTAERLMDADINMEPTELLSEVQRGNETDSGAMVLLIHRLAQLADPLPDDGGMGATALDDEVDRVRQDLEAIGETALDVGILASTLNAANVELYPELLYAVGVGGSQESVRQVEQALDRLEDHVLLSRGNRAGYQGPPELWSVRFLERYLETAGTSQAQQRFEACLDAVFLLSDRPGRCADIAAIVEGETPTLDRIATNHREWADEIVDAVFRLGSVNGRLAPLFPTSEQSDLWLPAVCSAETRAEVLKLRGEMYVLAGDHERARSEFRRLETLASEHEFETYRALASAKLGEVAERRGEFDQAQAHCETALDIAAAIGDRTIEAVALGKLGEIAAEQGEYDRAEEYYERSLAIQRDIGDRDGEAETLHNLGRLERFWSEYDRAQEYLEESLAIRRESGDREGEAESLHELGNVADKRGNYDQGSEYVENALAIRQAIGDRKGEAHGLQVLGDIASHRGAYDRAQEYMEESLAICREIGDRDGEATSLQNLGLLARVQGAFERAQEYHEQSLEISREIGDRNSAALTLLTLGTVAFLRGAYDQAQEYYEQSLDTYREIGSPERVAYSLDGLGNVEFRRGRYEQAREHYEESLEICREIGGRNSEATSLHNLGEIAFRRGRYDRAWEHFEESLEISQETGKRNSEAMVHNSLGSLARGRGNLDQARDHLTEALDIARDIGAVEQELRSLRKLGTVARERGDHDEAAQHFAEALDRCNPEEHRKERARIQLEQARLALARDDIDAARDTLDQAMPVFADIDAPRDYARVSRLRGEIASADGAPDEAREHYRDALDTFEEIGEPQEALRTIRCLVDCCWDTGDDEAATEFLERGRDLLETAPDPVREQHADWFDRVSPKP
jgi:tetratricopeptide (TPR) repeat protein/biotin operon repressor